MGIGVDKVVQLVAKYLIIDIDISVELHLQQIIVENGLFAQHYVVRPGVSWLTLFAQKPI